MDNQPENYSTIDCLVYQLCGFRDTVHNASLNQPAVFCRVVQEERGVVFSLVLCRVVQEERVWCSPKSSAE